MGSVLDEPAFPVDIGRYHQLFVYCDFKEPNVGNTKAPLLRSHCPQLKMPIRPPAVFIKCLIVHRKKS